MGVKQGSKPRADVLQGELDDAIFAASFGKLVRDEGPRIYRNPRQFFQNTHPTAALSRLCRDVFGRLGTTSDAGTVLRLSTGFGGGKTHALMALWHLAKTVADPTMGIELLPSAGRPTNVRVVGIDAEGAGYPIFARHGEQEARSLAAELAFQLGGPSALNALGEANSAAASPNDVAIEAMLPSGPVLILLDEIVLYMAKLTDQEVGNLVGFLRALMTAVITRKQAVLVITDPKDQPADAKNAARLATLARTIEQQTGRSATVIEPIGNETAQVIIRRLFDVVDSASAAKASADHFALYQRVAEEHSTLIPRLALTTDYAERIRTTYPLHPRLLDTAENRLRVLPDYNLSRGTLRLFARLVRSVWDDPARDPELITAGEIDWSSPSIQTDLLQRLDREKFRAAVGADVEGHAKELDGGTPRGAHRRVASALLLESLPLEASSGMDDAEITLAVLRPDEAGTEPSEALHRLSGACWHLYPMSGSANAWQFRYEPNILKQIEERMAQVPRADALDRLHAEVQKSFQGGFAKLLAWPPSAKAVPERPELQLALCDSEEIARSVVAYADDTLDAQSVRANRNAIMAIAPDAAGLEKAVQRIQRLMAAETIEHETPGSEAGRLAREQLKKQKPELMKATRLEAARAYNRLVLADGAAMAIDERFIVPEGTSPLQLPSGQDVVRAFVEDRKLVYAPTDSLFPDFFMDRIFNGAVPQSELPEARSTTSLQRRFLSAQGLKLVSDPSVIRASILRAVTDGRVVVHLEDGTAFDGEGAVYTVNGVRQRDKNRKLSTLPMDTATLVAEASSEAAKNWVKTVGFGEQPRPGDLPLPPPPPRGSGAVSTTDIGVAAEYADKRRLLSLRLSNASASDAQKVLGLVQPLGAAEVLIDADLVGQMKDGGRLALNLAEAKVSAAVKPLTLAQTLGNALAPGGAMSITIVLGFGTEGKSDLGALLRTLAMQLPAEVGVDARFAPVSG